MSAAVPGTPVTSANPNTTTNTALSVALASTTVGDLNVVTISGLATGTGINPTMATPSGWTKVREQMSNSGTPSTFVGIYWRFYQSGDGSAVTFSWTNTGQMVASCEPFSNADTTTPIPYSNSIPHASGASSTYAITGTTGADPGLLVYGGANKTGTAWSNLTDNDAGQRGLSSSATMCQRITATELAGGTAYSKTMTGSASTIGVQWAYVVKGAASAVTGTAGLTGSGTLSTTAAPNMPATVALSGTGSLSASGGSSGAATIALAGSGTLSASVVAAISAAVALAGSGSLATIGRTAIVQQLLTGGPQFVAHRNGTYATYGEETLEGYRAAALQYSKAILEISVWDSSDGVYVCSHDQTTGRVFSGTSLTITSSTWAALSGKTTLVGGNPIRRLEEILDAFPGRLFVVENKHGTNQAGLSNLLDAHAAGRWMFKGPYNDTANAVIAAGHGAPMWLYFYPSQLGNLSTTYSAVSGSGVPIVFGLGDYSAAPVPVQSDADTFYAFVKAHAGLMAWAHILGTSGQKSTADGQASADSYTLDGYMVSNFPALAPSDGALVALAGSGSLSTSGTPAAPASVALSGSGSLSEAGAAAVATAVALSGNGILAESATPAVAAVVALTGSGALAEAGSARTAAAVALAGSGVLSTAAVVTASGAASLSGSGALLVAAGEAVAVVVALSGAGVLQEAGAPSLAGVAALTGSGALAVAGGSGAAAAVVLTGSGVLTSSVLSAITADIALSGVGGLAELGTIEAAVAVALAGVGSLQAAGGSAGQSSVALAGDGQLSEAGSSELSVMVALVGVGLLATADLAAFDEPVALSGLGMLEAAGEQSGPVAVALAGEGFLLVVGVASVAAVPLPGSLRWRSGLPRWRVRFGPDRWTIIEAGVERWQWRAKETEGVKQSDRRLVSLQVMSPLPLNAPGVTVTSCTSTTRTVPDSPDEQAVVIPDSYTWSGPAGWAAVDAWVGPDLPLGTVYVLTHVQTAGEDFWDVAAAFQVEE